MISKSPPPMTFVPEDLVRFNHVVYPSYRQLYPEPVEDQELLKCARLEAKRSERRLNRARIAFTEPTEEEPNPEYNSDESREMRRMVAKRALQLSRKQPSREVALAPYRRRQVWAEYTLRSIEDRSFSPSLFVFASPIYNENVVEYQAWKTRPEIPDEVYSLLSGRGYPIRRHVLGLLYSAKLKAFRYLPGEGIVEITDRNIWLDEKSTKEAFHKSLIRIDGEYAHLLLDREQVNDLLRSGEAEQGSRSVEQESESESKKRPGRPGDKGAAINRAFERHYPKGCKDTYSVAAQKLEQELGYTLKKSTFYDAKNRHNSNLD